MECHKGFERCSNPNRAEILGERPGISLFQEPERPELLSEPAVSFHFVSRWKESNRLKVKIQCRSVSSLTG